MPPFFKQKSFNATDILDLASNASTHFRDITIDHCPNHAPVAPQPTPKSQASPLYRFKVNIMQQQKPVKATIGVVI